jgi:spermidine synthase
LSKRYLYFTVFTTGLATLGFELAASRLIGPYFGVSSLVWAVIIGLILIYLTVGYFIGGRLSDRYPQPRVMFGILAWGAFAAGVVPLIASFVLRPAANAFDQFQLGILFGAFAAVLILFIIPVTLLGMISPFAIRLAIEDTSQAGTISGRIYAVSTLGSFVGTFLPDLVLIPLVGTRSTFLFFSYLLLGVALVGLWLTAGARRALRYAWMPLLLAALAFASLRLPLKDTAGQIFEQESSYNYIQVVERDGYRYLKLNEGQGIHSIYHPDQLAFAGTWDQFLAAPFFNAPPFGPEQVKNMAIIGLAAGTTARQATAVFGPIPIDGYEIDPAIIKVGQEYFDMNMPNLNAIAEDGRWGLAHSNHQYDLIGIDAYRPPYIPWHLTTREFFQEVYDHLTPQGTLAINAGRAPGDRRLIAALTSTLLEVFPNVFVMDVPGSFNSIIYATVQPSSWDNLLANYQLLSSRGDVHPLLLESMERAWLNQQQLETSKLVFTDDRAPIEWITHSLILNFVLSGGTEELQ